MKKGKEAMLTDHMEGFQEKKINYNDYEVSFRRWLVSEIDSERMSIGFCKTNSGFPQLINIRCFVIIIPIT